MREFLPDCPSSDDTEDDQSLFPALARVEHHKAGQQNTLQYGNRTSCVRPGSSLHFWSVLELTYMTLF